MAVSQHICMKACPQIDMRMLHRPGGHNMHPGQLLTSGVASAQLVSAKTVGGLHCRQAEAEGYGTAAARLEEVEAAQAGRQSQAVCHVDGVAAEVRRMRRWTASAVLGVQALLVAASTYATKASMNKYQFSNLQPFRCSIGIRD